MRLHRVLRFVFSTIILAIFAAHARGLFSFDIVDRLEKMSYDYRLNLTAQKSVDTSVVIVDIDSKSINQYGRWPWSRTLVAQLVDTLFDYYHVQFVAFDVVFGERDNSSGRDTLLSLASGKLRNDQAFRKAVTAVERDLDYDRIFSDSLRAHQGDVALGFTENALQRHGTLPQPIYILKPEDTRWADKLYRLRGADGNLPLLQNAAAHGGLISTSSLDQDGIIRRVPMIVEYEGKVYESLSLAALRSLYGADQVSFEFGNPWLSKQRWLNAIVLPGLRIPVTPEGAAMVPYRSGAGSFTYLSVKDVIDRAIPKEQLDNLIVLIGTTVPGLMDLRSTPIQAAFPGVEVHANVISGALDGRIKTYPDYYQGAETLGVLIIGALLLFLYPLLSPLVVTLATAGLFVAINSAVLYAWKYDNLILPMASYNLIVATFFVAHITYGFFIERRTKQQITRVFGQYVPKEVVKELSDHPTDLGLEGESREMTVLFSDVRNFTTISESLAPPELKAMMNAYLTPITGLIYQHRGTVDKYIGDAVMAFWGAPLISAQHAHDAVTSGLAMLAESAKLRGLFAARGWPELYIGIGINTGFMNVGNMGSEYRVSYTVLGDAVNLGARLEGLTKLYGVELMVSEFTRDQAPTFVYRELDRVRVKGKALPVTIYEPLGRPEQLNAELLNNLQRYHAALEAYRQQHWDEAEAALLLLGATENGHRLYKLYLDRIDYYKKEPPGADWDRVFTHLAK